MWMRAVYEVSGATGGPTYQTLLLNKYGTNAVRNAQWVKRLKVWGFNALGEYTTNSVLPNAVVKTTGNTELMPFIRGAQNVSLYACRETQGQMKNILRGINASTYNAGGHFPDVFDSGWEAWAETYIKESVGTSGYNAAVLATSPWMLGTTGDDVDWMRGLNGPRAQLYSGAKKTPHLGYISAVTPPTQTTAGGDCRTYSYSDTEVYTKTALKDFLISRYTTIEAMNTAWGSSYSTFESNGGYGVGDGFLDEDGQSAWMVGNDFQLLRGIDSDIRKDLDDFIFEIFDHYYGILNTWHREYAGDHLFISNAAMNCAGWPQAFRAIGQYVDIVQCHMRPDQDDTLIIDAYENSGKPIYLWTTFTASADSRWNSNWGVHFDFATQELRGARAASRIKLLTNLTASDGRKPVIGIDWWQHTDNPTEDQNFGLTTARDGGDNTYDGVEAVIASGTDQWGYTTGGESSNYGDFMSALTSAFDDQYDELTTSGYGFTIKVNPGSTTAIVRYGWYAMGNVSCTSVIKTDPGGSTVDTVVQATGKSRRFAVHSGLSASTAYTANLTCNGYTYDALSFTTKAARSGTFTYTYGSTPPPTLPTADTLALYCTDLDGGCSENCTVNTVNDEGCGSGCTLSSSGLGSGRTYECYHEWRDDHPGGNVLSTSPKFYWVTP
jgi:hypothetical protein